MKKIDKIIMLIFGIILVVLQSGYFIYTIINKDGFTMYFWGVMMMLCIILTSTNIIKVSKWEAK